MTAAFPDSVVLCGMRDLKDYRIAAGGSPVPGNPGSPFNIVEGSLRMGDFTRNDVAALYAQHTEETGQTFTPEAVAHAYDYTQGQPWLVNALAYETTSRMMIVPPDPITAEHVDTEEASSTASTPSAPAAPHPHHFRPPPHRSQHRRPHPTEQGNDSQRAHHHRAARLITPGRLRLSPCWR
jgi:hypothetical protein